jgi:polyhydroxyalkanoate synthesis regulator phasin
LHSNEFGRVDENNNVFVNDNGTERQVGQYPNVPAADALAYFAKKFEDLEAQVRILEQRVASGVTDAKSLKTAHETLSKDLTEPNVVGNIQGLRDRIAKLTAAIDKTFEKVAEERQEAIAKAMAQKEEIATKAEALIKNLGGINWKKSAQEMAELFETWQKLQKEGPKVPKSQTDPVWKRFSAARAKFESGRRAYFAELDGKFKEAKKVKTALTEQAEALVAKGSDAAADYRKLQDQWKAAGKAGKVEEPLWARFRAAGDAIFAAKKEQDAELRESQAGNLKLKLEILAKVEAIDISDLATAKSEMSKLQSDWVKVGHVPKDEVRKLEDRMRKVEKKIADAEADNWRRSDPAAKARSNSLAEQLESAIAQLEAELASAPASKKKEIQAQIDARKSWLEAAQAAVN